MVLRDAEWIFGGPPLISQDLTVNRAAWNEPMVDAHMVDRPDGTGDMLLMLFHEDSLVDGVERQPWTLRCWPTGVAQRYGSARPLWHHSWMHLAGPLAEAAVAALPEARTLVEPEPVRRHLRQLVRTIALDRDAELAALGLRALLRCLAHLAVASEELPREWRELRVWLDQHAHEDLGLDDLAARVGLAKSRFSELFTAFFHLPPLRYVQHLRLERARWLLRDRRRTIAGIAREVGYEDVAYFSRLAGKRFGMPPSRLRDG